MSPAKPHAAGDKNGSGDAHNMVIIFMAVCPFRRFLESSRIMNDKFYVPFETAKRLKEVGYPQEVDYAGCVYTLPRGGFYSQLDIDLARRRSEGEPIAAPAYCELIDWFESKGLYINYNVFPWHNKDEHGVYYIAYISTYSTQKWCVNDRYQTHSYPTLAEALDEVIIAAIKLLNKQQQ